jgi:hypothetical protein
MRTAMSKIIINGRFLTQHMVGVQRFASEATKAMDRLLDSPSYASQRESLEIIAPRTAHNFHLKHIPVRRCGLLTGYAWEQIELARWARKSLLLNVCLLGPITLQHQAVVVHDASVRAMPDNFS